MGFRTGTVSYARFEIVGDAPTRVDASLASALAEHVLSPPSIGAPPEVQAGWSAGQHLFDTTFDAETVVFGDRLLFGMRMDTNRVPAEVRRAYRGLAEKAHVEASPTGVLNRAERQSAREEAEEQARRELADGRYRSSVHVPVLWDLPRRRLFAAAFSDTRVTALGDLLQTTFGCGIRPLSSGAMAERSLADRGHSRDYEDASPSPFTPPPAAAEAEEGRGHALPAVPWSRGGPEPKDFLGNEMLIWLWWQFETAGGLIETPGGSVAILIDRALDMDCAWDVTGKQTLRATGPTRLPEAQAALRTGKWPRKAGLLVVVDGDTWPLILQADRFLLTGIKIPRPEDAAAETPRETVERRLDALDRLDRAMVNLFEAFLRQRFDRGWASRRQSMAQWARHTRRSAPAAPSAQLVDA